MKKYIFILFALLFLGTATVNGQTQTINGLTITQSVHWSGTIIIRGDVVVARSGRLVINPGTTIFFEPNTDVSQSGRDRTKSEIIVEGMLIARGYINNKIIFSSNSEEPRMGDWYGISISNPNQISIFEYVTIEYAYNGLSIKKSSPQVTNSHLRYNFNAGIIAEVGSAPKLIGTIISENGYAGLICKLGAKPILTENLITSNQIGLVNLSMSEPNLGTRGTGADKNEGSNRLFDNYEFNFYNHSTKDISAINNYWGTNRESEIRAKIYDNKNDRKYGTVNITPILGGQVNVSDFVGTAQSTQASPASTEPPQQQIANQIPDSQDQVQSTDENTTDQKADDTTQLAESVQQNNLKHRTIEDIIGNFAIEKTTPVQNETVVQDKVQEKPAPPGIDYNRVFLDAFLDERKEIIKKVAPIINDPTRGLNAHGKVIVKVIVAQDGKVESAQVLRGLNYYYDQISLEAAEQFVFKSGTVNGNKVRFSTSIFFEF